MAFEIPENDLLPRWEVRLRDKFDTTKDPVDLTAASSAQFRMRLKGGATKVAATANITGDPTDGLVYYNWVAGDTDTVGTYEVKVVLTIGGKPKTYPNSGYWTVTVTDQIEP